MSDRAKTGGGKADRQAAQRRRLAVALRENLRRRKAKTKGRIAGEAENSADPEGCAAPHDSAGIAADKQSQ